MNDKQVVKEKKIRANKETTKKKLKNDKKQLIKQIEICPEVSSLVKSQQNKQNSVKYKVLENSPNKARALIG